MSNVMDGIRILEVAEHTFVPAASAILADWGAEVIKIEHVTRGDAARGLGSTGIAGFSGKVAVLMEHANRGKKSLGLDLTDPAGRDLLYRLAAISDVFLTNKMAGRPQEAADRGRRHPGPQPEHRLRARARATATAAPTPTPAATTRSGSGPVRASPTRSRPPTCPSRSTSPGPRSATRSEP